MSMREVNIPLVGSRIKAGDEHHEHTGNRPTAPRPPRRRRPQSPRPPHGQRLQPAKNPIERPSHSYAITIAPRPSLCQTDLSLPAYKKPGAPSRRARRAAQERSPLTPRPIARSPPAFNQPHGEHAGRAPHVMAACPLGKNSMRGTSKDEQPLSQTTVSSGKLGMYEGNGGPEYLAPL